MKTIIVWISFSNLPYLLNDIFFRGKRAYWRSCVDYFIFNLVLYSLSLSDCNMKSIELFYDTMSTFGEPFSVYIVY